MTQFTIHPHPPTRKTHVSRGLKRFNCTRVMIPNVYQPRSAESSDVASSGLDSQTSFSSPLHSSPPFLFSSPLLHSCFIQIISIIAYLSWHGKCWPCLFSLLINCKRGRMSRRGVTALYVSFIIH